MDQKKKIKEENNKKAAEFVRRLEDGNFPECNIELNYCSSSKTGAKTEASLFMVKR